jgi:hypothetical protein
MALPPQEQDEARQQYFTSVVAPMVPKSERASALEQFNADTAPKTYTAPDDGVSLGDATGSGFAETAEAPNNAPQAGGGRGFVNPPAVGEQPPQTSGSTADDMVRNFRGGLLSTVAGAGATLASAAGADNVAQSLDNTRQDFQQEQKEAGGDTILGKASSVAGSVVPAFLLPASKVAQLVGNAGLFAIPAFRDTLNAKLQEGQSFPLALAHASEAFGINLFMPTVATRGSGAVVKALGGAEAKGVAGAAAALGQAGAEGAAFSAANSALDKGTDLVAGQKNDKDWIDLKDMAANALGFGALRVGHVTAQALQPKPDPIAKIADAQNIDEAIAATTDAVSANAHTEDDVAGILNTIRPLEPVAPTLEQELAALNQRKADVGADSGVAGEPVGTGAVGSADTGAGVEPGRPIPDNAGGDDARTAGAPVVDSASGVAEQPRAAEPVAPVAPKFETIDNPSGTVTIKGDPTQIRQQLGQAGITSTLATKDGITVGLSQAARARDLFAKPTEPASVWFGRAGDGYKTPDDASMALPSRQRVAPELAWKIEPMPNGKFRLAGYADAAIKSSDAEPVVLGSGAERVSAVEHDGDSSSRASVDETAAITNPNAAARIDDVNTRVPAVVSAAERVSLNRDGTATVLHNGDKDGTRLAFKDSGISNYAPTEGGYIVGKSQAAKAQKLFAVPEEKASQPLSLGIAPGSAEPITVKDGVVHVGKDEAVNFDTGEPIKVRDGASDIEIKQALKDGGAVSRKAKFFGGAKDAQNALEPAVAAPVEPTKASAPAEPMISIGKTGGPGPAGGKTARSQAQTANPFKAFIAKHGISIAERSEFAPGTYEQRRAMVPGYGPIFRRTGKPLDTLVQDAIEEGFLPRNEENGEPKLREMITQALDGKRIIAQHAEGVVEAEAQAELKRREELANEAASALEEVPDVVLFHLTDEDIPWDTPGKQVDTATFLRALGASEEEIAHEVANETSRAQASAEGRAGDEEAARVAAQESAAGGDEEARAGDTALTSPTREDILAQQDRGKAGERNAANADRVAAERNQADAERGDFKLTGSDRAADANDRQMSFATGERKGEASFTREEFSGQVERIAGRLGGRNDVRPVWSADELPDSIKEAAERAGVPLDKIRGVITGKANEVYIVGSAHSDLAHVQETVFHELYGHYGLRKLFGNDIYSNLSKIYAQLGQTKFRALAEKYGLNLETYNRIAVRQTAQHPKAAERAGGSMEMRNGILAEELLAHIAQKETGKIQHLAKEVIGGMRQWMRGHGLAKLAEYGETDLAHLLKQGRDAIVRESPEAPGFLVSDEPAQAFSVKADTVPDERGDSAAEDKPEAKPYDGPGAAMLAGARDLASSFARDLTNKIAPMSTGTRPARAAAQKFANDSRVARYQWQKMSEVVKSKFTKDERRQMWDAADEQNTLMQQGKDTAGKGLDALPAKQRAVMEQLHGYADSLWKRAQAVGMVDGEGLPFWTPRMAVMVGEDGSFAKPGGGGKTTTSSGVGRNVMTSAPSAMHRKYVGTAESEAALKAKKGDNAQYVHDILTMPLAMSRFEQAIAGRELINTIKEIGLASGTETVNSKGGPDFFTLDHPAFTTFKPRMADGKAVKDEDGGTVMDRQPLFISKDFEGPLKAVMSNKDGAVYSGYMLLKSKAMSAIMASPLTHNMVIYGRALAYSPVKVGTGYLYWKGHMLAKDDSLMREAIGHGLVPIGANKNSMMDITDVARGLGREGSWGDPNESWVSLSLQKLGNAIHEGTGDAIKSKTDALGDFVHHTLLWKQVGAVQIGIYHDMYQYLSAKGMSDKAAGPLAAHFANRYAGAVANENMSEMARKTANVMLFSRSFNMGNLGAMKDTVFGMSAGLKARMLEDVDALEGSRAMGFARRKAVSTLLTEVGMSVLAMSVVQSAVDKLKKDKSWDDISEGYKRRLASMFDNVSEHPFNPASYNPYQISPTFDNEPKKKDRISIGAQPGGREEYIRLPTGKVVEDMIGWTTELGETFAKKMSPMAKAVWQDITNDKGYGIPVKDPEGNFFKHVYDLAAHVAEAQLPWDSVKNLYDMTQGKATDIDKDKLVGFATGFSPSQGHPGGPEAAVAAQTEERFSADKKYQMELVKRDLKYGDEDSARTRMENIGMTPREITQQLNRIDYPKTGLSRAANKHFNNRANEEERKQMDLQR